MATLGLACGSLTPEAVPTLWRLLDEGQHPHPFPLASQRLPRDHGALWAWGSPRGCRPRWPQGQKPGLACSLPSPAGISKRRDDFWNLRSLPQSKRGLVFAETGKDWLGVFSALPRLTLIRPLSHPGLWEEGAISCQGRSLGGEQGLWEVNVVT